MNRHIRPGRHTGATARHTGATAALRLLLILLLWAVVFFTTRILGVVALTSAVVAIVAAVLLMLRRKGERPASVLGHSILVGVLLLSSAGFGELSWDVQLRLSGIQVDEVAGELENFRMVKGDYPRTLAELVPDYLEEEPRSWMSERIIWYRPGPEQACLVVPYRSYMSCSTCVKPGQSRRTPWECFGS